MRLQTVLKRLCIIVLICSCTQVYTQNKTAAEVFEGVWYSRYGDLDMVRVGDSHITCHYSYYNNGETVYGSLTGFAYTQYNDYTMVYEYNLVGNWKETINGKEVGGEFEFLIESTDLNSFSGIFDDGGVALWEWDGSRP